jgi:hypothetical protein
MHCIFCYQELIIGNDSKIQARKRLIFYYKKNGIISLKKHVDAKHIVIDKVFKEGNKLFAKRKLRKTTDKEKSDCV